MKPFTAAEITNIVGGILVKGSGELLLTDAADRHDLLKAANTLYFLRECGGKDWDAIKRCLPCAVVAERCLEHLEALDGCTVIMVEDVENAYWNFAEHYRGLFDIPVIAVTGTSGKTTTKNMIMQILKKRYNVTGTENTSNGLVRNREYLLRLDESIDAAVFETAVSHPGTLAYACRLFKPTIGIITTIGADHIEGCGTLDGYIKAKAEMLDGLGDSGILIVNADDENTKKIGLESFGGRIVYFGVNNHAHLKASDIKYKQNGMEFTFVFHHIRHKAFVTGYGEHQVYNALAAIAASHELGMGINEILDCLRSFLRLPHQLQLLRGIEGSTIIDDTWNTNPTSLKAAVKVLDNISKGRIRCLVVGDINELGDSALDLHRQVGDMIVDTGAVDMLVTVGKLAGEIAERAKERGFEGRIYTFPDAAGVADLLKDRLNENTIVLFKFSGLRDISIRNEIKAIMAT